MLLLCVDEHSDSVRPPKRVTAGVSWLAPCNCAKPSMTLRQGARRGALLPATGSLLGLVASTRPPTTVRVWDAGAAASLETIGSLITRWNSIAGAATLTCFPESGVTANVTLDTGVHMKNDHRPRRRVVSPCACGRPPPCRP